MDTVEIRSLEQYIAQIEGLPETDFFRGVGDHENHKLIPSAGRLGIKDNSAQLQIEKDMLERFKRHAPSYTSYLPANDVEWLFLAQHHGLPTRLLDWTFNPLVALFFALENDEKACAAVYRAYPFSTPAKFTDPFEVKQLAWVVPNLNNIRYKHQDGLFTLHSVPNVEDLSKVHKKYIIPQQFRNSIRWKLRKIGISKAHLFPSLDSLAYDSIRIAEEKYPHFIVKE